MRQRLFLDRLAFRKRIREAEQKMGGMRIQVPAAEKLSMVNDVGEENGEAVEPYNDSMEGFLRKYSGTQRPPRQTKVVLTLGKVTRFRENVEFGSSCSTTC